MPLVIAHMRVGMEKGRRKVQMFAAEQVGRLRSYLAQNITVQGILEKSCLANAV